MGMVYDSGDPHAAGDHHLYAFICHTIGRKMTDLWTILGAILCGAVVVVVYILCSVRCRWAATQARCN